MEKSTPEEDATFFSQIVFNWMRPLFVKASELHLEGKFVQQDDLIPVTAFDHSTIISQKFDEGWKKSFEKFIEKDHKNEERTKIKYGDHGVNMQVEDKNWKE